MYYYEPRQRRGIEIWHSFYNSACGVLDTTLCNKVCQWLATGNDINQTITEMEG
jgi:hypothetical protein